MYQKWTLNSILTLQTVKNLLLDNTRGQVARRAFCVIKKRWVFATRNLWFWNLDIENRNLRFWNLDFPKLTISIFENWTFRVLLLLLKIQNLVEVSLMLSLVRKWGVHTDTQPDTRTSPILGVVYTKGPSGKKVDTILTGPFAPRLSIRVQLSTCFLKTDVNFSKI